MTVCIQVWAFFVTVRIFRHFYVSALMVRLNTLQIRQLGLDLSVFANLIIRGNHLTLNILFSISLGPIFYFRWLIYENFTFLKNTQIVPSLFHNLTFFTFEAAFVKQHCFNTGSGIFILIHCEHFIRLLIININSSRQMLETLHLSLILI